MIGLGMGILRKALGDNRYSLDYRNQMSREMHPRGSRCVVCQYYYQLIDEITHEKEFWGSLLQAIDSPQADMTIFTLPPQG